MRYLLLCSHSHSPSVGDHSGNSCREDSEFLAPLGSLGAQAHVLFPAFSSSAPQNDGSVVNECVSSIDLGVRSPSGFRWRSEISETLIKCCGDPLLILRDTLSYI